MIPDNETSQNWWEVRDEVKEIANTFNVPQLNNNLQLLDLEEETKKRKFSRQLADHIFLFLTVFFKDHKVKGILVGVFKDFLILVNKCNIIEVPLREIEAVKFLALGCPDCSRSAFAKALGVKTKNPKETGLQKTNDVQAKVANSLDVMNPLIPPENSGHQSLTNETPQLSEQNNHNHQGDNSVVDNSSIENSSLEPVESEQKINDGDTTSYKKKKRIRCLKRADTIETGSTVSDPEEKEEDKFQCPPLGRKLGNRHVGYY